MLFICIIPSAFAQTLGGEAGIGFMAISPPLTDTLSSFDMQDMLYGVTVSYVVRPWLGVSTDVMYLGDLYYGPDSGAFTEGPLSWTSLSSKTGSKADWKLLRVFYLCSPFDQSHCTIEICAPLSGTWPCILFSLCFHESGCSFHRLSQELLWELRA